MLYHKHLQYCESHGLKPCAEGTFYKRIIERGREEKDAIETPVMSRGGSRYNLGKKSLYVEYVKGCEEFGVKARCYEQFCKYIDV